MKLDRSRGGGNFPNVKLLFSAFGLSALIAGGFAIFGGGNDVNAAPPQQEIKADTSGHAEPATFDH